MKLIVLAGKDNCGKTKSLNKLASMISKATDDIPQKTPLGNPAKNDWEYIFDIKSNGKRLVISTWGDYPLLLRECCERNIDCDAVICACNLKFMKGRVYKPFEDTMSFDKFATIVMKASEPDERRQDESNNEYADYIIGLIKHFGII